MKLIFLVGWACFVLMVGLSPMIDNGASCFEIVNTKMQIKESNLNGDLRVTLAQWDVEFDEDVYFWSGPPCAPGLSRPEFTRAGVAANPCWAGCNFAVKGDGCGAAFNQSDASCVQLCRDHPQRQQICADTDWDLLEVDEESDLYHLPLGQRRNFRMNWLLVEQGFIITMNEHMGQLAVEGFTDYYHFTRPGSEYCYASNYPDPYTQLCPSSQCYLYGTHFIQVRLNSEQGFYNYWGDFSLVVRSYFIEDTGGQRATVPPAAVPATLPLSVTPFHVPLQFAVPVDVYFPPLVQFQVYQLTTAYCGLVMVQLEPVRWNRTVCHYAVGLSTDPTRPFPGDVYSDIIFPEGSGKPLYVCPDPTSPLMPDYAVLYLFVARYALSDDPPLSNDEMYYLTVDVLREGTDWRKFRLGSSPSDQPPWPADQLYSRHAPFPLVADFQSGLSSNTFEVHCPDPASPANATVAFTCRAGSAFFGTCLSFFSGYPSSPYPTSMIPIPPLIKDFDLPSFSNLDYRQPPVSSRVLSTVMLLDVADQQGISHFQYASNWDALIDSCVLVTGSNSPFASANGTWPLARLAVARSQPQCRLADIEEAIKQMNQYVRDLEGNPTTVISQRIKTDLLTFQDPWQGCTLYLESSLMNATKQTSTLIDTTLCLDQGSLGDPCCDPAADWSSCCLPRTVEGNLTLLVSNEAAVVDSCHNPKCVDPLLSEYSLSASFQQIGGCQVQVSDTSGLLVYRQCLTAAFGQDFEGRSCNHDSDCPNFGSDASAKCDLLRHVCVQSYDYASQQLFECLAEDLPSSVRISLFNLQNWTKLSTPLVELLQQNYGNSLACVTELGTPWSLANWHIVYYSFLGCPVIPFLSVDPSYRLPPWADTRYSSCSGHSNEQYFTKSACGSTEVCNWDPSDACDEQLEGSSFCGVCETPSSCLVLSDSTDNCQQQGVCFLADGSYRTDLDEAACNATGRCTELCAGVACANEQQCLDFGGRCLLRESIFTAIEASDWMAGHTVTGFCAFPINPNNSPDCSLANPSAIPSSYGCIVYGNCTATTPAVCTPHLQSKSECLQAGGAWYAENVTETECLATTRCSVTADIPSLSSLGNTLLTAKDSASCQECGGQIIPVSSWQQGRWMPGSYRPAAVQQRSVVAQESLSTVAVDFAKLFVDLHDADLDAISFQLQNNLQCTYASQELSVLSSVCDCPANEEDGSGSCFPQAETIAIGRGRICPDSHVSIVAYPGILTAYNNSLSANLVNECVELSLARIAKQQFARIRVGTVTTGFVHPPQQKTKESFETVENEQGAVVGQVLGDALQIHLYNNAQGLRYLSVCLSPDQQAYPLTNAKYSVLDLGYLNDQGVIIPLGLTATLSDGYVCANVSFSRLLQRSSGATVAMLPVARKSDWTEGSSQRLSSGEKALLYVVATLFALETAFILIQVARLILVRGFSLLVPTNVLWLVFSLMTVIRAVYFYLVAADVLGQPDEYELVDFWMIDLPVLLYLFGNLLISLSFFFLHASSRYHRWMEPSRFWYVAGAIAVFLVLLFVAVLLAFNFAVIDGQGIEGSLLCPTLVDNSTNAMIIRIIYESILFFIALAIALTGAFFSNEIANDLKQTSGSGPIFYVGATSSVGVLTDSLAFLIYYIVDSPSPYFAIVLIFTEVVPIAIILAVLSTQQIKKQVAATHSARSNASDRTATSSNNSRGRFQGSI